LAAISLSCAHTVFTIRQDRIRESELPDAGGNLRGLPVRMRSGLMGEWNQDLEKPILNPEIGLRTMFKPSGTAFICSTASPNALILVTLGILYPAFQF
jgi:hypothetical protein